MKILLWLLVIYLWAVVISYITSYIITIKYNTCMPTDIKFALVRPIIYLGILILGRDRCMVYILKRILKISERQLSRAEKMYTKLRKFLVDKIHDKSIPYNERVNYWIDLADIEYKRNNGYFCLKIVKDLYNKYDLKY